MEKDTGQARHDDGVEQGCDLGLALLLVPGQTKALHQSLNDIYGGLHKG